jgi:transposase
MSDISVHGLDIAKNVFHVCGMNQAGKVLLRKQLYRDEVLEFFAQAGKAIVAIESCGGSSYWAREIERFGHTVRVIPAQFVKPYVKSQKNDVIDAEAIAEAALRPTMRFVSPNTMEQQDIQNVHRVRDRLVKQKVALANQIRGLLLEYGITIAQGPHRIAKKLSEVLVESEHTQRALFRQVFTDLRDELIELEEKIKEYDQTLRHISAEHPVCKELEKIRGIGPVTSTAIYAAVSNPTDFQNGRQFSAWLGLVPKQHSTGGKQKLLGITKKGDKYIRKLLVHGARMEVRFAKKQDNQWLLALKERRGYNKAAVAQANKNARRIWATMYAFSQEKLAA